MIDFRAPVPEDREWVDELFFHSGNRGCEYSFTNLFTWSRVYRQRVARVNDYVAVRLSGSAGNCYLYPAGRGDLRPVILALEEDAHERGYPCCRLICVTPDHMKQLEELWPGEFSYTTDRSGFDYLYEIDRLADLGGRKLHAKRNHIHRFEDLCPDWTVEEITPDNLQECVDMDDQWTRLNRGYDGDESLVDERDALRLAFAYYESLKLEGLLLRHQGRVIAFTMGRQLSPDTYDVNFEKAYGDIQGAYAIINREFARWVRQYHPQVRYLNREDDMGVEGLRNAKESYFPDLMVEKHSAIRCTQQKTV